LRPRFDALEQVLQALPADADRRDLRTQQALMRRGLYRTRDGRVRALSPSQSYAPSAPVIPRVREAPVLPPPPIRPITLELPERSP
jgi:hypothetical protein